MNTSGLNMDPKAGHPALGMYSLHTVSGIPPADVNISLSKVCRLFGFLLSLALLLDCFFPLHSTPTRGVLIVPVH